MTNNRRLPASLTRSLTLGAPPLRRAGGTLEAGACVSGPGGANPYSQESAKAGKQLPESVTLTLGSPFSQFSTRTPFPAEPSEPSIQRPSRLPRVITGSTGQSLYYWQPSRAKTSSDDSDAPDGGLLLIPDTLIIIIIIVVVVVIVCIIIIIIIIIMYT